MCLSLLSIWINQAAKTSLFASNFTMDFPISARLSGSPAIVVREERGLACGELMLDQSAGIVGSFSRTRSAAAVRRGSLRRQTAARPFLSVALTSGPLTFR
jgi:hypothetical protein